MRINGSTNHSLWDFYLDVYEQSYTVATNKSTVIVSAYMTRKNQSSFMQGALIDISVSVSGSGTKYINYQKPEYINVYVGTPLLLGTQSFEVQHNPDGTMVSSISANFTSNISPAYGSASGSLKLTDIPRATTPQLSTTQAVLGKTTIDIVTVGATQSFTHKIMYSIGSKNRILLNSISSNKWQWKPDESLALEFKNKPSETCYIICETYQNNNKIGETSTPITLLPSSSMKPTIGEIIKSEYDEQMLDNNWGLYVQNHSKIKLTIPVTLYKESPIKYCKVDNQECTLNDEGNYEYFSELLTISGINTLKVEVCDYRNQISTMDVSFNVEEYHIPVIEEAEALRCNEEKKIVEDGEHLLYTFKGKVTNIQGKNSNAIYKIEYKVSNSNTSDSEIVARNTFTINKSDVMLQGYTFLNTKKYELVFSITDSFETIKQTFILSTVPDLINFNPSGKSLAFGTVSQASENETKLDIALDTNFTKSVMINNQNILTYRVIRTIDD